VSFCSYQISSEHLHQLTIRLISLSLQSLLYLSIYPGSTKPIPTCPLAIANGFYALIDWWLRLTMMAKPNTKVESTISMAYLPVINTSSTLSLWQNWVAKQESTICSSASPTTSPVSSSLLFLYISYTTIIFTYFSPLVYQSALDQSINPTNHSFPS
jgi:hypothetical protein